MEECKKKKPRSVCSLFNSDLWRMLCDRLETLDILELSLLLHKKSFRSRILKIGLHDLRFDKCRVDLAALTKFLDQHGLREGVVSLRARRTTFSFPPDKSLEYFVEEWHGLSAVVLQHCARENDALDDELYKAVPPRKLERLVHHYIGTWYDAGMVDMEDYFANWSALCVNCMMPFCVFVYAADRSSGLLNGPWLEIRSSTGTERDSEKIDSKCINNKFFHYFVFFFFLFPKMFLLEAARVSALRFGLFAPLFRQNLLEALDISKERLCTFLLLLANQILVRVNLGTVAMAMAVSAVIHGRAHLLGAVCVCFSDISSSDKPRQSLLSVLGGRKGLSFGRGADGTVFALVKPQAGCAFIGAGVPLHQARGLADVSSHVAPVTGGCKVFVD